MFTNHLDSQARHGNYCQARQQDPFDASDGNSNVSQNHERANKQAELQTPSLRLVFSSLLRVATPTRATRLRLQSQGLQFHDDEQH